MSGVVGYTHTYGDHHIQQVLFYKVNRHIAINLTKLCHLILTSLISSLLTLSEASLEVFYWKHLYKRDQIYHECCCQVAFNKKTGI